MCAKKRDVYLMSNGQPVTEGSVSGLCGILDKPGLVYWAANEAVKSVEEHWRPGQNYDQQYIELALKEAKSAHRRAKDTAGDFGTRVHKIAGAYAEGQLTPGVIADEKEAKVLSNLMKVTEGWEWLGSEITLVKEWCECGKKCTDLKTCPALRGYGGTADGVARVNGRVLLIDFKTSNSVQATYTMQCALYALARPVGDSAALAEIWSQISEARILHFDKELLTWEVLERNITEQYPYVPHFIGCHRWKKRYEQNSYSTYTAPAAKVTPDNVQVDSSSSISTRPPQQVWMG